MTKAPLPATSDANADAGPGLFGDPLADWTNDDILLTKPARAELGARNLRSLRVIDWPELRALFVRHDTPANRHGRRDRRLAIFSIAAAATGLILAAFAPLAAGAESLMGAAAVILLLGGGGVTAFHVLDSSSTARWLGHRFWTERVRALYFQVIVNNLGLVAQAMRDDAALGEWKATRARALRTLATPDDLTAQVRRLAGTVSEDEAWVLPEWASTSTPPEPSEELDFLLSLLRSQRFDTQIAYTDRKLGDWLRAPKRRSQVLRLGVAVLPAATVLAGAAAGVLFALGQTAADPAVKLALALAVSTAAAALALRMINDDLQVSEDASRYAVYGAAVRRARARFDAGDLGAKLAALREMEVVAYRDLREFVAAHWRIGR